MATTGVTVGGPVSVHQNGSNFDAIWARIGAMWAPLWLRECRVATPAGGLDLRNSLPVP